MLAVHNCNNCNKQVQGTFQHDCHAQEARTVLFLYSQFLKAVRRVICMDVSGNEVFARDEDPSAIPPPCSVLCMWGDSRFVRYPCHQAAFCCNSPFAAIPGNITYDSRGNFTKKKTIKKINIYIYIWWKQTGVTAVESDISSAPELASVPAVSSCTRQLQGGRLLSQQAAFPLHLLHSSADGSMDCFQLSAFPLDQWGNDLSFSNVGR